MTYRLGGCYKCIAPLGSIEEGACCELLWYTGDSLQVRVKGTSPTLVIPKSVFRNHFAECPCNAVEEA